MTGTAQDLWVLGIDSGGSGVRVAVTRAAAGTPDSGPPPDLTLTRSSSTPTVVGERGIEADSLLARVVPDVEELLREAGVKELDAACVGAAGMATLGDDLRARLPGALTDAFGVRRLALAADGVTAYAGSLGQRPGAVVAGGTGLIALGVTPEGTQGAPGTRAARSATGAGWRRADGWGHLLGDCGSGAWIGRAGLEAAMRAYDGRQGGSPALLERAEAVFGPAGGMPGKLYPRPDRSAVLASFAPEVAHCADRDPVAHAILREAARHIAQAAEAVCPSVPGSEVALTGGLFRIGEPLLAPLRAELSERLPRVRAEVAAGDPLTGSLRVASALATDSLRLPLDRALLQVM